MYNYSDISLGKLEEDLKNTFEECKVLVSNIKSSEDIDLSEVAQDIIPDANATRNLGSASNRSASSP